MGMLECAKVFMALVTRCFCTLKVKEFEVIGTLQRASTDKCTFIPCLWGDIWAQLAISHLFLAYFPCFEKIKVDLWDHLAVCLYLGINLSTFGYLNQSLWNLVRMSWCLRSSQWGALHIPRDALCLYVYSPLSLLGKDSVNTFPRQRLHEIIDELLEASFLCSQSRTIGKFAISYCQNFFLKYQHSNQTTSIIFTGNISVFLNMIIILLDSELFNILFLIS
jgi:hypothetical protein